MSKRKISNISSVAIIYAANDPSQLFIEMKDDTHPLKSVRGQLCPFGGNWAGVQALADKDPLDTVRRELGEEFNLVRRKRNGAELIELGLGGALSYEPTPISGTPTEDDIVALDQLVKYMCGACKPIEARLNDYPTQVIRDADPASDRQGFTVLSAYYGIALPTAEWTELVRLQKLYGNLSADALSFATSLKQIIATGQKTSFGHDHALQSFFYSQGYLRREDEIPMVAGTTSTVLDEGILNYAQYLDRYDIAKIPEGVTA